MCNLRKCRKKQALNRLLSSNFIIQNNLKNKHELGGTLNLYATGPRHSLNGNWNAFAGTLNVYGQKTGSYDPECTFNNSNGMRNATLNVTTRMSNSGKAFAIGQLTGNGTLAGGGRYTVGYLNQDITFNGTIEGCPITKVGSGTWTLSKVNSNLGSGNIEVRGGLLNINNTQASELFFGTHQVVVQDSGTLGGRGYLQSIMLQNGGTLKPGNATADFVVGLLKVKESIFAYEGSHIQLFIYNNKNTSTSRSYLDVGSMLSIDGDITVTMKSYTPKLGDEILFWNAKAISGTPTAVYLPDISSYGLAWDTSDLMTTEGILRVIADESSISEMADNTPVSGTVYTLSGMYKGYVECQRNQLVPSLRKQGIESGTYLVRLKSQKHSETVKVTIR